MLPNTNSILEEHLAAGHKYKKAVGNFERLRIHVIYWPAKATVLESIDIMWPFLKKGQIYR